MVLLSFGEERIEGAYTLRNESEEESFREMLTPTKSELGSSEEREEEESSEKDKPYLTKMMTLPLVSVTLVEKNTRSGAGAIGSQSRKSMDPERGRNNEVIY